MKPGRSGLEKPSNRIMLIDANIFLEVELAESHADACKQFLKKVRDGYINSAITDFHVDSIVIVMEDYGKRLEGCSYISSLTPPL